MKSETFAHTLKRALACDPAIGDVRRSEGHYAAPFHDPVSVAYTRLHERIPAKAYGTIICVPWLRTGGADLVACQLAEAVQLAKPGENVLILQVDHPNFDRPDWVPAGVDVAHISDVLRLVPEDVGERLLFTLIQALQPSRVVNVNSLCTWRMFERFGRRLEPHVNLYAYLFCWDQTAEGYRVGYPSMFYPTTAGVLQGVFTDTSYLRDELLRIYRPPADVALRTVALSTPSRTEKPAVSFARLSAAKRRGGERPRVLWAGRLDRQKRFDLVQQIAQRMPGVDFLCWGDPVLDVPPDHAATPRNLTLRPGFKSYSELPLEEADLWLFTSAWEGMPTILIEVSIRGMAVVASQVGGVPELIDEETGFPVFDVDDVDAYVAAVQRCLDSPEERVSRADRLRERAAQRYSQTSYVNDLTTLFAGEGQRD
jgi:glycosyltransferase involved in cell wall biosynthesis